MNTQKIFVAINAVKIAETAQAVKISFLMNHGSNSNEKYLLSCEHKWVPKTQVLEDFGQVLISKWFFLKQFNFSSNFYWVR